MKKKKADHLGLEKFLRKQEHRPYQRESYKGMDVYLSEGGPYYMNQKRDDYPLGWWESAYAVGESERVFCIQVLEFDKLHNMNMTEMARTKARIASAREAAHNFIDRCLEVRDGETNH